VFGGMDDDMQDDEVSGGLVHKGGH
jgi:hypothetical protein